LEKVNNSNSRTHRFSANYANHHKLNNRFSVLAVDALERGQQTPVQLKHKGRKLKLMAVETEKNKNKRKILLLGSNLLEKLAPYFKKILELKLTYVAFLKQMPLFQRLLRI
jgi:hypothetical protein